MSSQDGALAEAADHQEIGEALGTDYSRIRDELTETEV